MARLDKYWQHAAAFGIFPTIVHYEKAILKFLRDIKLLAPRDTGVVFGVSSLRLPSSCGTGSANIL